MPLSVDDLERQHLERQQLAQLAQQQQQQHQRNYENGIVNPIGTKPLNNDGIDDPAWFLFRLTFYYLFGQTKKAYFNSRIKSGTKVQPSWQLELSNPNHRPRESTMSISYTLNTSACFKIIEKITAVRIINENNATLTPT